LQPGDDYQASEEIVERDTKWVVDIESNTSRIAQEMLDWVAQFATSSKAAVPVPTLQDSPTPSRLSKRKALCASGLELLCITSRGKLSFSSCWRVLIQSGRQGVLDVDREKVETIVSPPPVDNVGSVDGRFGGVDFEGVIRKIQLWDDTNNDFSFGGEEKI
jgi:hypothetical protein